MLDPKSLTEMKKLSEAPPVRGKNNRDEIVADLGTIATSYVPNLQHHVKSGNWRVALEELEYLQHTFIPGMIREIKLMS